MASPRPETPSIIFKGAIRHYNLGGIRFQPMMDSWSMLEAVDPHILNGDHEEVSRLAKVLSSKMGKDLGTFREMFPDRQEPQPDADGRMPKDPIGELEKKILTLSRFIIDPETVDLPKE